MKLRMYASALGLPPGVRIRAIEQLSKAGQALDRLKKALDNATSALESAAKVIEPEDPAAAGSLGGLGDVLIGLGADVDEALGDLNRFRDREDLRP